MNSVHNQRPPEPKVAGSNLAWRAENSPVVTAQGDTETRENARPGAAVNTNRQQSGFAEIVVSGRVVLVDSADLPAINQYPWHLSGHGDNSRKYPARWKRGNCKSGKTHETLHRFLTGARPGEYVDHINGDTLDNRRCNLRVCTNRQNGQNVRSSKNQKIGGHKGVSWNRNAGKWEVHIAAGELKPNGKRKPLYLGLYADPTDAARAYDAAALKHFGEFAAVNFANISPEAVQ